MTTEPEPRRASLALWQRYCPEQPVPEALLVLEVAADALQLMRNGSARQVQEPRECDEYAPDVVRFWLTGGHWQILEGGPKSVAAGVLGTGGDRMVLAQIKADLEWATDDALGPILHWYAVAKVYKRQERFKVYIARRACFRLHNGLERSPSLLPVAEAVCYERIARALGWSPEFTA